jgi:hypothetical protein
LAGPLSTNTGKERKVPAAGPRLGTPKFGFAASFNAQNVVCFVQLFCFPVRHFDEHNLNIRHRKDKSTKFELIVDEKGKKRKRPAASGNFNSAEHKSGTNL